MNNTNFKKKTKVNSKSIKERERKRDRNRDKRGVTKQKKNNKIITTSD